MSAMSNLKGEKICFFDFSFPGISPKDDILSLLKLMSSKNPVKEIAANIALEGGYDPCTKFTGTERFWKKNIGCDPGFTPGTGNEYCFKVLPTLETMSDGQRRCQYEYGAEMILFRSDSEVLDFFHLIHRGSQCFHNLLFS
jgi:hypothetical protein